MITYLGGPHRRFAQPAEHHYPLLGLHEPGGEHLMQDGAPLVFTHELGHNPDHLGGFDYRPWARFRCIARLNNGYGAAGTIPLPRYYADFARRVQNFVANSRGCTRWIIANEPGHIQERPDGRIIHPTDYGRCFALCYAAIKDVQPEAEVIMAPIAPWYPPESVPGGYLDYFELALHLCEPDAIALHTYSRGSNPGAIHEDQILQGGIYKGNQWGFRAYRDFLDRVPPRFQHLPVYVTECNQDGPWLDEANGWWREARREIEDWNASGGQRISALVGYRWPRYDQWHIDGLVNVQDDFAAAALGN